MNFFDKYTSKISELCKRYNVKKLFAFGSVLTDHFNENSDVDLIVEFKRMPLKNYANNYFDFKFSLQNIFNKDVDLLESQTIKNPVLQRSIERNKLLIYG